MKTFTRTHRSVALTILAPWLTAVSPSGLAQSDVLEEIVVTAEKRSANVQDVPISISVFSGERLIKSGIEDSLDLEMVTPGLNFSAQGNSGQLFIRGIGSTVLQGPGADPSSAVYIDGVYQSRFSSSQFALLDPERIEVLKGPQGTLYGRNATGGAINYITKEPTSELGGEVNFQYGNYNLRKYKAQANIPLSENLFFRGSVMHVTRDGYTENLLVPGDDIDRDDFTGGHFALKYILSDATDITLRAGILRDKGDVAAGKHLNIDPEEFYATAARIDDPRKVMVNQINSEGHVSTDFVHADIRSDLGWAEFTSLTAYTEVHMKPMRTDFDATEIEGLQQGQQGVSNGYSEYTETMSQEFMLSSLSDGRLHWQTGLYFLRDNPTVQTGFYLPQFTPLFLTRKGDNEVNAYAAFANLNYDFTDQLRLNAGIRYSYEEKEYNLSRSTDGVIITGPNVETDNWSAWTPKVGIDYFLSKDVMLYASVSRGFKSGGFNTSGPELPGPSVDPEYINAYEAGVKSTLWDGKMRLNLSAFHYDYSDLQVQSLIPSGSSIGLSLQNAAEADIDGVEVEMFILPIDALRLNVGLSWLDARYGEFFTVTNGTAVNVEGNMLPQAPKFTASVGAEYTLIANDFGDLTVRTDYYYSDEKFFTEFNDSSTSQPSYSLINARVDFRPADSSWSFAIYGKNLTDELTFLNSVSSDALFGDGFVVALGPPRTYGVSLEYAF